LTGQDIAGAKRWAARGFADGAACGPAQAAASAAADNLVRGHAACLISIFLKYTSPGVRSSSPAPSRLIRTSLDRSILVKSQQVN
jgi:hypothetical protein